MAQRPLALNRIGSAISNDTFKVNILLRTSHEIKSLEAKPGGPLRLCTMAYTFSEPVAFTLLCRYFYRSNPSISGSDGNGTVSARCGAPWRPSSQRFPLGPSTLRRCVMQMSVPGLYHSKEITPQCLECKPHA